MTKSRQIAHFANIFTKDDGKMPSFDNIWGKNFIVTLSFSTDKVKKALHFQHHLGLYQESAALLLIRVVLQALTIGLY